MAEKRAEMQTPGSALWGKNMSFQGMLFHAGKCNVCGNETRFYYTDPTLYRESLVCGECLTTSRYRSIAPGILKAIQELTDIKAASLSELQLAAENISSEVYA